MGPATSHAGSVPDVSAANSHLLIDSRLSRHFIHTVYLNNDITAHIFFTSVQNVERVNWNEKNQSPDESFNQGISQSMIFDATLPKSRDTERHFGYIDKLAGHARFNGLLKVVKDG